MNKNSIEFIPKLYVEKNRLNDFMVRPRYIYAISRFVPMNPVIDCAAK